MLVKSELLLREVYGSDDDYDDSDGDRGDGVIAVS